MVRRRGRAAARLAGVLTAALALIVVPAGGAAAQPPGRDIPDMALVVSGTGGTTALRSGDPYFARLWQLLQPTYAGTERVSGAWVKGGYPPVRITVVWGLTGVGGWPQTVRPPGGDVALQRQDQLFVAEDGTPWVRSDPAPEVEDDDIRWHRAPRSVFEQLDREGRLGEAVERTAGDQVAVGRTATDRTTGTGLAADATTGDGSGPAQADVWWAAAGGLAVGIGGTLLIRGAAARRGAGPPQAEPRQELIEL